MIPKKFPKHILESELESEGQADSGEEDPVTDTDFDEDDRMDNDFPEMRE